MFTQILRTGGLKLLERKAGKHWLPYLAAFYISTVPMMDWFTGSRPERGSDGQPETNMDTEEQRDRSEDLMEDVLYDALDETIDTGPAKTPEASSASTDGKDRSKVGKKKSSAPQDSTTPKAGDRPPPRRSDRKRRPSIPTNPAGTSKRQTTDGTDRVTLTPSSLAHITSSSQNGAAGQMRAMTLDNEGREIQVADPVQAQILAMLTALQKKVEDSETRSTTNISHKIDGLEQRLVNRIDRGEREVVKLKQAVSDTASRTDNMRKYVDKKFEEMPALINKAITDRLTAEECRPPNLRTGAGRRPRPTAGDPTPGPSSTTEERYWTARRSLRVHPVEAGENLEASVLVFLARNLKMPTERTCDLSFTAKQLPSRPSRPGRTNKITGEVLLTFESVEQRDEVKGYARNLQGQENTGVDIEVPFHLRSNFANLRDLAYRMRIKSEGLKRNIRLDDRCMDVVMDFSTSEGRWTTVTAGEAKTSLAKRKKKSCTQKELDEAMGTSDLESGEENL